jgi:hypothetical protein
MAYAPAESGRLRFPRLRERIRAEIATPAFVSTLCICIVFVPMFFLRGVAGYLHLLSAQSPGSLTCMNFRFLTSPLLRNETAHLFNLEADGTSIYR